MDQVAPVLLAVGTTHPLNIAGLGLDARAAMRLGVRVVTVVAGISAQDARTVLGRTAVDAATIRAQFRALQQVRIDAVHVGALLDAQSVHTVASELETLAGIPVICDPVIAASGGGRLADDATLAALRDDLFKRCLLVTPNLDEAEILTGQPVRDVDAMRAAGIALRRFGAGAVLVKGGHLASAPTDVLVHAEGVSRFEAERIAQTLRGTGDLLACAIAARCAYGDELVPSITAAQRFVRECIARGVEFAGTRTLGVRRTSVTARRIVARSTARRAD